MKIIPTLIATLLVTSFAFAGAGAKVTPYAAPDTDGVDQEGKAVKFSEVYKANPFVIVYFYPKADTPGCTKQGCSLRDAHSDLTKLGAKVIGVSHDAVAAQKAFSDKFTFPFTLIADTDATVIKAFNVVQKQDGKASRECFLIKNGQVVWHDAQASTDKQAEDIKKAMEEAK